ncbi:hypothetical protein [Arenimonas sp.]|uniref:hypothetical protein n=1 Tax=Arenimonas sp. TaxID=1872635 RepID=UPI0035AF8C2D
MKRLRRHRLCAPLSILAMVALLWTQLALASHPACTLASMAFGTAHAASAAQAAADEPPCHPPSSATAEASPVCDTHCSRTDLNSDAARVLAVPALGPLPIVPVVTLRRLPREPEASQAPGPQPSWHGPIRHPASLLLI